MLMGTPDREFFPHASYDMTPAPPHPAKASRATRKNKAQTARPSHHFRQFELMGAHLDGTVLPLALGVWFWSALIALTAWTLVQRHGEPRRS